MRTLILILTLLVATSAVAPVAEARPHERRDRVAQAADRKERIKQRIRTVRAVILADELALDEATAAKLVPILNRYDDELAKLARESLELRKLAETTRDDAALDDVIDKLVANQRARWDLDERRFAEVRKVLTARQAARILVVLPEIDRRILAGARRALKQEGKAAKRKAKRARKRGQPAGDEVKNPFGAD